MIQLIPATCSLTARPRTLICSNGICAMPSVALANLLQPPQQEFKAGIDAFIIDSGSGQHLIRRSMVASDSHLTTCPVGILLQTANGLIRTYLKTRVFIRLLNIKVDAWVLDDTPLLLSMGKLVTEHGCDFGWRRKSQTATLTKDGKTLQLTTQRGVPILPIM